MEGPPFPNKSMGLKYNEGNEDDGSLSSFAPLPTGAVVDAEGTPFAATEAGAGAGAEVEGAGLVPSGTITNCLGTFDGAPAPAPAPSAAGPFPPNKSMGLKYKEGNAVGDDSPLSFALSSAAGTVGADVLFGCTGTLTGADALVAAVLGNVFVILSNVGVKSEGKSLLFVFATGAAAGAVVVDGSLAVVGFSTGVGNINCGK